MIEIIIGSVRNEYDRKICRGGWGGGCFSKGEGGREYVYVSFKENHLPCKVRFIGYIRGTLKPV